MRYFRAPRVRFFSALLIIAISSGCAGQGSLGTAKQPGQPGEMRENQPVPPESPVAAVNKADQILDLLIDDSAEVTLLKMTGNAPLQDYQFRRSGDRQFVLELSGIKPGGALNLLPISSDRLTLSDGGRVSPNTIQILGTLEKPLDYYVLNSAENVLSLALHLAKDGSLPVEPPTAPPPPPSKTSRGAVPADHSELTAAVPARTTSGVMSPDRGRQTSKPPNLQGLSAMSGPRTAEEITKKRYTGKPISLDLLDADLKNVLRLLADITGTNMVIEPDVSGRVTIKVEKVAWDQVLDMILAMNDLGKEESGNVIRIARLMKLKQEWNQQVEQIRAKQELLEVAKDIGAISTAYLTVNYAQPVEIAAKVTEVKSDRGRVSVDERSSLVIYTDYPARIEAAKNLLARLDRATTQVMIEARIVTANQTITKALGTEWHAKFERYGITPIPGTRTFEVNRPADPLFGFTIASLWGQTLASIDFKLSALETSQEVNIVAAPKVLTINNMKAVISQGTQIPYLVRSDYGSSSTQFKDAVVELQVTPHITPDQKVRLEIQAKQDEPTGKDYQVGDSTVPGIETRKITTELLVDDGQVIVIGGVMRNREEESNRGTPGFKNIPILGWLFKNVTEAQDKTELLIFISPQIIESSGRSITRSF
jgi:type IV pilus assembly protein PilQ